MEFKFITKILVNIEQKLAVLENFKMLGMV